MQILPEEGTLGSQLGAALGRGASQAFPEAFKQGRLASGLQALKNAPAGTSLFDLASQLQRSGASPQDMATFIPMIQQELGRNEGQQYSASLGGTPTQAQGDLPSQTISPTTIQTKQSNFERMSAPDFMVAPDETAIPIMAAQLRKNYPNRFASEEAALAEAERKVNARYKRDVTINERKNAIEAEKNKALDAYLQKSEHSAYKDIAGEVRQGEYLNDVLKDALDGSKSPLQAGQDAAKKALEFAKDKQKLRSLSRWGIGKNEDKARALDALRKEYKNRGRIEEFRDDLMSYQGLDQEGANLVAYPLSSNVKKILDKTPNLTNVFKGGKENTALYKSLVEGKGPEIYKKFAEETIKNLSPEDSFQAISLASKEKGLDPTITFRALNEAAKKFPDYVNTRQSGEIKGSPSFYPSMGRLLLSAAIKKYNYLAEP